ncbi:MAG: ABC transporter ATP-binding protein [Thermoplasmatales archaeon]|jgi:ABC-2 type transport system ATP-binding protein|nr:ABC transporter ATP-binding protein [Candidatus Thermoplasmatota archaeon]MCL6002059.1 ABC transporter ATP-binding protein [Candidatus Thermoplasmatota archaeon]MDA8054632.1 ABC transporter ATP-binding protein [Thermoplasmatales archaeon]
MSDAVIDVSNLVKTYSGLRAVDGISFSINRGEVFSLLGPNGAGKTTTVEILEGVRNRTSGEITVLGEDPEKSRSLIFKVGILPQDFAFIYNSTPKEALDFYKGTLRTSSDLNEILEMVELEDKATTPFQKLSGGQKQKLGLALSLVNDPEILFLDEPTSGLDPRARRNIWKVIKTLKERGKSILLTTHYLEEAELLADKVAIMNRGKIIDAGTPMEIVERHHEDDNLIIRGDGGVEQLLSTGGFQFQREGSYVKVNLRNIKDATDVINYLYEHKAKFEDFTLKRESLEDVFVRMVGEIEEDETE